MKIYIDWENRDWYAKEEDIIESLIDQDRLPSFNEWLGEVYNDNLKRLFDLSEEEKERDKKRYKEDSISYFRYSFKDENISILEINTDNNIKIKES